MCCSGVGLYFLIGAFWGCGLKWYFFCTNKKEKYNDLKRNWLRQKGFPDAKTVPDKLRVDWASHLKMDGTFYRAGGSTPGTIQVRQKYWDHKARVLRWMTYWPWSMFWSLLDDVVRNVFRHLQRFFSGVMDRISNFVFRDVDADFTTQKDDSEV